ncbi:hypothetical protein VTI74DRAFT_8059 [Chaetomium olivicolor]
MAINGVSGMLPPLTASTVTISIAFVLAYLILHALSPAIDPREPPLVKARIPLVGHIIGFMRYQAQYHINLQRSTRKPIATLPMLTGKLYAVWDPHLVAAGLRSKSLSTKPHTNAVMPALTQISDDTANLLRSPRGDHLFDRIMLHAIPASFKGASIERLNETALAGLAAQLTTLAAPAGDEKTTAAAEVPNTWLWLRGLLTSATGKALYGAEHNPFATATHPRVEPALWDLESNLLKLTLNLPAALASAGHRARETLVQALAPYYAARHDEDPSASDFVRFRAAELRAAGIPAEDIAHVEIMLPFAALANTVPLLFWLFCFVFSRQELVARLRGEVETLVATTSINSTAKRDGDIGDQGSNNRKVVTLRVAASVIEERCPLLMSCYRETLRRTVHQVSTRTAMQDTVLSDRSGREYLLKAGSVVQMAIGASHAVEDYWGDDVDEFRPERFLRRAAGDGGGDDGPGSPRAMRAAFQPFGGGTHLCPGRHFAFTEMMAVMATLLLGFEVQPLEGTEWKLPAFATRSVIDAVTKPARRGEGFGVRITRREGWEGVQWKYEMLDTGRRSE